MRYILLGICLFLPFLSFAQEEVSYKEYTYTEFFEMIEQETDTVFTLSDAVIYYNSETDKRFRTELTPLVKKNKNYNYKNDIIVDKHLVLSNVQFTSFITTNNYVEGALTDIYFKKSIEFSSIKSLYIEYCRFDEGVLILQTNCDQILDIPSKYGNSRSIYILYSDFDLFSLNSLCNSSNEITYYIKGNSFKPSRGGNLFPLNVRNTDFFVFEENEISNVGSIFYSLSDNSGRFRIRDNKFNSEFIHISKTNSDGSLIWTNNSFTSPLFLELSPFSSGNEIDWNQFEHGIASYNSYVNYTLRELNKYPARLSPEVNKKLIREYMDSVRVYDADAFGEETAIKSHFYSYYRSRYNTQIANEVYLELKDFETQRLKIIHDENPNFRSYFKWKVNQFLKLFSDYGTEPSKAIVVSVYVILGFALIYLFFPNHWDSHGKNRIIDRFSFFLKYMKRDAGMHDVYLEEKQVDILAYDEYKQLLEGSGKDVPKFFQATGLPLYKWAISSTKMTAGFLSRVDVMKGTWSELPQSKRVWKSVLLISAFMIALLYDIFIKMLNALMLSINTFTTLGFGEIPIKGLPRYLAIVQGFIGWFMLTIFSVSLISQLLN